MKMGYTNLTQVTAGGLKTSVCEAGAGQTIMMIHGATYSHRLWAQQIGAISSIGGVYALDLPGHGASSRFPAGHAVSIKSYVEHVHDVLKAIGRSSTVLIGHSMGGAIAVTYALEHPSEVEALILVGTGAKLGVSPLIFEALSSNYRYGIISTIAQLSFSEKTDKHIIDEGVREMLKCPQDIAIADFKACNEFDARSSISRIEAPTLIVVGEEDKLTPVKWSEYLHSSIGNSKIRIVKAAGHMVMIERPGELNACIISFLKEIH
jgi:pimeloyl-ACP methyl ester carboxylesterase